MAIDRKALLLKHNPLLYQADTSSPLTVGNAELAFTADVTGMQSLYDAYADTVPLCTMSQWGWHTQPVSQDIFQYTLEDLEMTEYDFQGRTVRYPKEKKAGNEAVYDWLRKNPHRLNLAKIGLLYKGEKIQTEMLTEISQELNLYEGILESCFRLDGIFCLVQTACSQQEDVLAFQIESEGLTDGTLQLCMEFPYGSPDISGSDWEKEDWHCTEPITWTDRDLVVQRTLDKDQYYVKYQGEYPAEIEVKSHRILITVSDRNHFAFKVGFSRALEQLQKLQSFQLNQADTVFENSRLGWNEFWEQGGIIKLHNSKDKRAIELERRIILSQYLLAVNSCGSGPPQETGLTCNSWYGKMHLEMYLWHCGWLPLWNHTKRLEKSLNWYLEHIEAARENAAKNGYKGVRWPKMIASEGIDAPSPIAPLLVWQQPHVIYMLELAYQQRKSEEILFKYWILIQETADFMVDFVVYDKETDTWNLEPPLIPVQERFRPEKTKNPAFEVEYWYFTLKIACRWAKRMGKAPHKDWETVVAHMARLPVADGLYQAHEWCSTTFTEVHEDHPSMLGALGLIPSDRADSAIMKNTLKKVLECWDYASLWGWDFAMMAMTAVRLGEPELAVDIIMKDTLKNSYVISGNNLQKSRKDLPLYLPGNGGLLLAVALMAAGYEDCGQKLPGFPKNGQWEVEYEQITPYFE